MQFINFLQTYTNIKKKNICDIATTPPMKNPTAIELWNFLIIIVPPILNANSINADHIEVNASLRPLVDMTAHDIRRHVEQQLIMNGSGETAVRQAYEHVADVPQQLLCQLRGQHLVDQDALLDQIARDLEATGLQQKRLL